MTSGRQGCAERGSEPPVRVRGWVARVCSTDQSSTQAEATASSQASVPRPEGGGVLASSSRSQLTACATSAVAGLARERPSVAVRWRPPLEVAIVTHLVTRSLASGAIVLERMTASMRTARHVRTSGRTRQLASTVHSGSCQRLCAPCCTFCCTELTFNSWR